ncbi:MAG: DUF131 domain-containing protein [Candidatus Bathyarchaeia archaeon]
MDQLLFNLGLLLFLAGFAVTFIAILLLFFSALKGGGKVRGGGAVILGPLPIIFGTDKESVKILLILSIILITLLLIFTLLSAQVFS